MTKTRRVLRVIGIVAAVIAVLFAAFLLFLTIAEYRPADVENAELSGTFTGTPGQEVRVLTFNIGYAGLGKNQDFFMDGGTMVRPNSKADVENNLTGIADVLRSYPADAIFVQEADRDSKRSYGIDEVSYLAQTMGKNEAFAYNFRAAFVPYPLPTIGRVNGGLLTLTGYTADSAERIALPASFRWPVSTCNLKRCLLVYRVPYEGRELVLVNLHLEAYDEGAGKAAQTRALMGFLTGEYEKGNYVIAGGDFNQKFPGVTKYPVLDGSLWQPGILDGNMLPGGWRFAADGSAPTCRLADAPYSGDRSATQLYVIDGFILSPNVRLKSVKTIDADFAYSDHNPVLMTAELA